MDCALPRLMKLPLQITKDFLYFRWGKIEHQTVDWHLCLRLRRGLPTMPWSRRRYDTIEPEYSQ